MNGWESSGRLTPLERLKRELEERIDKRERTLDQSATLGEMVARAKLSDFELFDDDELSLDNLRHRLNELQSLEKTSNEVTIKTEQIKVAQEQLKSLLDKAEQTAVRLQLVIGLQEADDALKRLALNEVPNFQQLRQLLPKEPTDNLSEWLRKLEDEKELLDRLKMEFSNWGALQACYYQLLLERKPLTPELRQSLTQLWQQHNRSFVLRYYDQLDQRYALADGQQTTATTRDDAQLVKILSELVAAFLKPESLVEIERRLRSLEEQIAPHDVGVGLDSIEQEWKGSLYGSQPRMNLMTQRSLMERLSIISFWKIWQQSLADAKRLDEALSLASQVRLQTLPQAVLAQIVQKLSIISESVHDIALYLVSQKWKTNMESVLDAYQKKVPLDETEKTENVEIYGQEILKRIGYRQEQGRLFIRQLQSILSDEPILVTGVQRILTASVDPDLVDISRQPKTGSMGRNY